MGAFNLDVNHNWTNNGIFNAGAGTVSFVGTVATPSINGAAVFNNVVFDRTGNTTMALGGNQQISGTMTLTNGIVTNSGTLRFLAGSSVTGASNASHVVGAVQKAGNTAFTFPVGRGGLYRPMSMAAPANITDIYSSQYFNTSILGSFPNSNHSITIDHVSAAEWWQFLRTAGTSPTTVTLSWDSNSGGVTDPSTLRVSGWNGSLWADYGNASTTGNASAGTVTATTANTAFGAFTLASTSLANSLPVQLSDMQCGVNDFGYPEIDWATQVEINSDYFEVERSSDGHAFTSLGRIPAKGNSRELQRYSFEDENAPDGKSYYRLKQVDRGGHGVYYEVCAMQVVSSGLSVTPNPTSGKATIRLATDGLKELTVINSVGQKVNVDFSVKNSVIELDMSTLAPGVYLVRISTAEKSGVLKLVKS